MLKLSKSDAGKLGAKSSLQYWKNLKKDNEEKYLQNPKLCRHCNSILSYDDRAKQFCNHTCSATFNNLKRDKKIQDRMFKL